MDLTYLKKLFRIALHWNTFTQSYRSEAILIPTHPSLPCHWRSPSPLRPTSLNDRMHVKMSSIRFQGNALSLWSCMQVAAGFAICFDACLNVLYRISLIASGFSRSLFENENKIFWSRKIIVWKSESKYCENIFKPKRPLNSVVRPYIRSSDIYIFFQIIPRPLNCILLWCCLLEMRFKINVIA